MKIYEGKRGPRGAYVVVTEHGTAIHSRQLKHVVRHSPNGFEWGYGGSGPADLARSLLIDHFGGDEAAERRADEVYQEFKWKCISKLPYSGWSMDSAHIDEVLRGIARDREHGCTETEQAAVVELAQ